MLASILGQTRSATPEQYATLVALVARQLGVPARVVSGFRIGTGSGATVPAGSYRVTTQQAWTWVEIPIRGRGWVVLDASPSTYSSPNTPPSVSARPSPSQSPSSTPNAVIQQSPSAGNPAAPRSTVPGSDAVAPAVLVIIIVSVLAGLILLSIVVLLLRKRLRARRRRRVGDPRRRLIGAWLESLDVLIESGLHELDGMTSAEIAAATAEQFGAEPAAQARFVGNFANAAIFSPTSWIGTQEADAAWRALGVLRKTIRERLTMRQRMSAGLRYHRRRKPRPLVGPTSWAAVAKARASGTSDGASRRRRARHSSGRRRVH